MSSGHTVTRIAVAGAFVCLAVCVGIRVAVAEPIATATEIPVGQRPLLDGKLTDACWQKGDWQTDFKVLSKTMPATQQTRFCVLYDEDNIYIAAECMEPDMDQLKEVKGGGIFRGECIEIFFDIDCDQQTDYHLTTNSIGVCEGHAKGREIVWRAGAYKAQDRWSTEAAIPFSSFVIGPQVGSTWRFNVCRQRYAGQRALSTWAQLGPMDGFHQPEHFGELHGLEVDFSRFRYVVGDPQLQTDIKGRALNVRFEVPVKNDTGQAGELRLEGSLIPPVGKPQSSDVEISLDQAQELSAQLSGYTVTDSGDYKLLVALTDPTAGRVYYRAKFTVQLDYTPLAIRMIQPCYRDTIFATQDLKQIELAVEVGLDEAELKNSTLYVELGAASPAPQPLQTQKIGPLQASPVLVRFDATELPVGAWMITAKLADGDGKLVATTENLLHKLPPAPGSEVRIDENNNTVINGVPTFIYGYFAVGLGTYPGRDFKAMVQTASDGCTALLDYNQHYWSEESGTRFLDTAHKNGLGVAVYPYYRTFFRDGGLPKVGAPDPSLSQEMREGITERVLMWKDHPAFVAWYLADEPDCANTSPEALEEVYQLVRSLDPYHPCIVLCSGASTHHAVRNAADIFMPDPYIHPRLDGKFDTPLTVYRTYFETIKQEGKAPWITPQAFASGFRNESTHCEPGFEHLRAMAYMSLVHNCKGVLYYAWCYLAGFPASHHGARHLSREVAAMAPVLLAPDSGLQATVKPPDAEIEVLVKEYEGDIYIIAVNTQFPKVTARFEVPGLNGRQLSAIFEGRKVKVTENSFGDHFDKYEVHLYTTAAEPPDVGQTVQQVQAEVAEMQQARFKEGNLALRMTKDGRLSGVNVESEQGVQTIDGYTNPFTAYRRNVHRKLPADLTISFPRQETVARVVVYSPNMKSYEIQIPDGDNWRTVATVAENAERVISSRFDAVKTDKLRLHITAAYPPEWEKEQYGFAAHGAIVDEIEVYGP